MNKKGSFQKPAQKSGRVKAKYVKGEVTLEKMRHAALMELTEKGYHRTSVCEIVRRADLTRGAFYNYWNSLDECIIDLFNAYQENFFNDPAVITLQKKLEKRHPSRTFQRLVLVMTMVMKKNWKNHHILLTLLNDRDIPTRSLKKKLKEYLERRLGEWTELVEEDKKNHIFRSDVNSDYISVGIMNFMAGLIHIQSMKLFDVKYHEGAMLFFLNSCLTDEMKKKHPIDTLHF